MVATAEHRWQAVPEGEISDSCPVDVEHAVAEREQSAHALSGHGGEGTLQLHRCPRLHDLELHSQRPGGQLRVPHQFRVQRIPGIRKNGYSDGLGDGFLQELQVLADQLGSEAGQPRDVAIRPGEAGDEAAPDRIVDVHHDDGDRRRRVLGRQGCHRDRHDKNIGLESD